MEEINLYDLLRFYAKRWLTIAIAAMIGAIISITYTYFIQQPQYKSSATILLVGADHSSSNQGSVTLNNYVKLFTSRRVLDPVITNNEYSEDYKTLSGNTTAENVKNTDIINVSMSNQPYKNLKSNPNRFTVTALSKLASSTRPTPQTARRISSRCSKSA